MFRSSLRTALHLLLAAVACGSAQPQPVQPITLLDAQDRPYLTLHADGRIVHAPSGGEIGRLQGATLTYRSDPNPTELVFGGPFTDGVVLWRAGDDDLRLKPGLARVRRYGRLDPPGVSVAHGALLHAGYVRFPPGPAPPDEPPPHAPQSRSGELTWGGMAPNLADPRIKHHSELQVRARITDYRWPEGAPEEGRHRCLAKVSIDEAGVPTEVRVEDCLPLFHAPTREALLQWRWEPHREDDAPVAVQTTIAVHFEPPPRAADAPPSIPAAP